MPSVPGSLPRRWRAACALGFLAASCSRAVEVGAAERDPPPSIIVISVDTLRWDHTSLGGYERDTTPYLARLAAECVVFERAYTVASWTLPAHMTLLTGLYPEQHKVWTARSGLSEQASTIAERLRDAGYHTVGLYYPGWIAPRYGFDRGFEHFASHQNAAEADDHLTRALADAPAEKPLFLFLHLFDAHSTPNDDPESPIYAPPEPWADHFLPDATARVAQLDKLQAWEGGGVTDQQHEAIVALYDDCIRYVDAQLERWLESLREDGRLDRSFVVITSDHGEGLAQRGVSYGGHGGFFEEGLHIPLLLRFPNGRFGGERVATPVSLVDVRPTIEELVGLEPDVPLPGVSLLAPPPEERILFAQRVDREVILGWPHKVLVDRKETRRRRIYDMVSDPGELSPLRDKVLFVEPLERARREKADWFFPAAGSPGALDAAAADKLRALGYGGALDAAEHE